jgi:hypothetical protein
MAELARRGVAWAGVVRRRGVAEVARTAWRDGVAGVRDGVAGWRGGVAWRGVV